MILKINEKVRGALPKAGAVYFAFFFSLVFIIVLAIVQLYVHEAGHIIGCAVSAVHQGKPIDCHISNIIWVPVFSDYIKVPVPQQTGTNSIAPTLLFALGGPLFSTICFIVLAALIWLHFKLKRRIFWLILIPFLLIDVFNVTCGTDNPTLNPYPYCAQIPWFKDLLTITQFGAFVVMIYLLYEPCLKLSEAYVSRLFPLTEKRSF